MHLGELSYTYEFFTKKYELNTCSQIHEPGVRNASRCSAVERDAFIPDGAKLSSASCSKAEDTGPKGLFPDIYNTMIISPFLGATFGSIFMASC